MQTSNPFIHGFCVTNERFLEQSFLFCCCCCRCRCCCVATVYYKLSSSLRTLCEFVSLTAARISSRGEGISARSTSCRQASKKERNDNIIRLPCFSWPLKAKKSTCRSEKRLSCLPFGVWVNVCRLGFVGEQRNESHTSLGATTTTPTTFLAPWRFDHGAIRFPRQARTTATTTTTMRIRMSLVVIEG